MFVGRAEASSGVSQAGEDYEGQECAGLSVGGGPIPRALHDRGSGFRILEASLRRATEGDFSRIHDMQDGDLVAAVSQKAQRLEREGAV